MHDLWCWELVAKAFKQYDYVNRYIDVAVMHEKSWTIQTISGLVHFWNMSILKLKSQNAFLTLLSPINNFTNINKLADLNIFGLSKFNFQRLDNSFWNSDAIPNLMQAEGARFNFIDRFWCISESKWTWRKFQSYQLWQKNFTKG